MKRGLSSKTRVRKRISKNLLRTKMKFSPKLLDSGNRIIYNTDINNLLLKNSYRLDQVLYDLIGKPVGVRRGPATVTASDPANATVREHGKAPDRERLEPGDLPDQRFCLTRERRGRNGRRLYRQVSRLLCK